MYITTRNDTGLGAFGGDGPGFGSLLVFGAVVLGGMWFFGAGPFAKKTGFFAKRKRREALGPYLKFRAAREEYKKTRKNPRRRRSRRRSRRR